MTGGMTLKNMPSKNVKNHFNEMCRRRATTANRARSSTSTCTLHRTVPEDSWKQEIIRQRSGRSNLLVMHFIILLGHQRRSSMEKSFKEARLEDYLM